MKFGKLSLGVAAAALAAAPVLAQASISPAVAPLTGEESELKGASAVVVALAAAAAVVVAIVVATDNSDGPISN